MKFIHRLPSVFSRHANDATDSMERSASRRHAIIVWGAYLLVFAAILAAIAYVGSTYRTKTLPTGKLTITTPYTNYLPTDEIVFTVTNRFNSQVVFKNNCPNEPLSVYRWDGAAWKRVHAQADPATCRGKSQIVEVPSGGSVTGSYKNVQSLFSTPGYYRIVAYVDALNSMAYRDIRIVETPVLPPLPLAVAPAPSVATTPSRTRTPTSSGGSTSAGGTTTAPATPTPAPTPTSSPTLKTATLAHAAGTIIVDYSSTTLYLKSVSLAAGSGCSSYEKNRSQGTSIEINFKCASGETQVQISISGGVIRQTCQGARC